MQQAYVQVAELPDDSPRLERRAAALVAGAFFVLFLGWAAFTPLDAGAIAPGTVVVAGNRQAVQHRDGGIVSALNVREGQSVRQGEILLKISASEILAQERGVAAEVYTLLAQRERLKAERDGQPTMLTPPEYAGIPEGDRVLAQDALAAQQRLLAARRGAMSAQKGVLGQRSRQTVEQISGYERQRVANREQRRLFADEIAGMKELERKGFAATNRIRALERQAAELDGTYGALGAQIARSRESMGEFSMQSLSLDRDALEKVSGELRDVSLRLDELQPKLTALREQLARSEVRAPATGKIVGLKVFTVGGVVAAGQVLMEVVPHDRELVIEAKASPNDADDIQIGLETQLRFPAIQERNLPILYGKVAKVSADSFSDDRTGAEFFKVEIRVPVAELQRINALRPGGNAFRPGLPAEILIPLRKRSALAYLLEPLTQPLWLAGREQ
ncbi:HlyD family type I secretion periplasmic adaptor subunit [Sphingomonas cavernae]|uniref:Membrane fusion protein (MFP) family protein n=1 Tax=Sphingomonas cavernae TaxID=2320861 RepID=A0A418WLI5_9SPHN|nr:HlyD family type I secretion periplasmic adaptor subunit [Sphingomonas cavernae]RJF90860.1 HlyD family type I secretion periplasmic adaptor subunit [Sphingomonas cavernae]